MHVVIFEGSLWPTFAPLSLSRPVFTLGSGTGTLLEKQIRHLHPTRVTLWVRPELEEHCRVRIVPRLHLPADVNVPLGDEPALLVAGRTLIFNDWEVPAEPCLVTDASESGDLVRMACTHSPGLGPQDVMGRTDRWMKLQDLPQMMPQGRLVESLWDLIHWNEESLITDAVRFHDRPHPMPAGPYHLVREDDVWIGEKVTLEPGCVLDAGRGPVVLGNGVSVGANAVIQGPCYVGDHTAITPLTVIRPGTSIGPMCKIGGEVSNSIVLGWTNKAHEGYLGDSYLGKWVNFGSGTTTSNLKNTYGEISLRRGGRDVPTGRRFLGALVGDHTKTAVLTRLAAGTYVGFNASLAGSGFCPRFIPSYSFWTDKGTEPYDLAKAIDVTKRVYSRRDRPFTEYDEHIMRYVSDVAPSVER